MPEHQVLDERYVDKGKLVKLLRELFPNGDFQVEVSHDPIRRALRDFRIWLKPLPY